MIPKGKLHNCGINVCEPSHTDVTFEHVWDVTFEHVWGGGASVSELAPISINLHAMTPQPGACREHVLCNTQDKVQEF